MTLFLTLLPLYLVGNLHCLGMCGPLVMLIGQHRYRLFYIGGRLLSFSLAGLLAGEAGAVLHVLLKRYYLAESVSLICGLLFILWGLKKGLGWQSQGSSRYKFITRHPFFIKIQQAFSLLLLKEAAWSTFLFGFFTVLLPCGQTLVVFSACALAGSAWIGLGNGFAFALLTTPALLFAMHTLTLLRRVKSYDRTVLGASSVLIGLLACCRGLAELGWINHWGFGLAAGSETAYHFVLF